MVRGVFLGGWVAAAALMGAPATAMGGAAGGETPQVVVHPLTPEERLQQDDYMAWRPLSEDLDAFSVADPELLEERAANLAARPAATESPFLDWARYAALAVAGQDPQDPRARERVARWGAYWKLLSKAASASWAANTAGRAESVADNALCAYRADAAAKAACFEAAKRRAGEAPAELSAPWGAWVRGAAEGLAGSAKWPRGWAETRARIVADGSGEAKAAELEGKLERMARWAELLDPPGPVGAFDALAEARAWAKLSCWSAGRPDPWARPCLGDPDAGGEMR